MNAPGLYYLFGDATKPQAHGAPHVITHVVNDAGAWGKGFVVALNRLGSAPKTAYKAWSDGRTSNARELRTGEFRLGEYQIVNADTCPVVSLVAQRGYAGLRNAQGPFIRYDQLRICLTKLSEDIDRQHRELLPTYYRFLKQPQRVEVHMPRIGAGLAGGDWKLIEPIIQETIARNRRVVVYDLEPTRP